MKTIVRTFSATALALLLIVAGTPAVAAEGGETALLKPLVAYDPRDCEEHTRQHHDAGTPGERQRAMEAELQDYLRLAEQALSFRAQAIQLYRELKTKSEAGEPLSGHDLKRLNEGAVALLAQRSALIEVAEAHECWIYAPAAGGGNPREAAQEAGLRATGIAMSLSAALILYDNYLSAIAPYRQDHEFRRHLNRADKGFDLHAGTLNQITMNFASPENRQRTRLAVEWFERQAKALDPEPVEHYRYLVRSIEQSPSLQLVRRVSLLRDLGKPLELLGTLTVDSLFALKNEGTNLTSLLFGNTIGLVETRRGKLYDRADVARHVGRQLRAGDILVEKTPFRLTDVFIPGHWGHAAIWVGSEAELRALGIWEHPVVRPHQAAIRKGRGVVEALRSGVEMNTLGHFLNVDDLAVLRHAVPSAEQQAEIVLHTLRQVGKAYDFNFDAETTHRVFCSKLVYLAYGDLQWPTSRMLGRVTVSPDNIAVRATGDGPLAVVLLYREGEEVTESPRLAMEALLAAERIALARREQGREQGQPLVGGDM
ncbi:MAG: Poxvirus G6 [Rhodocyclales bacterium]|nr:Poxvirus G6 [Rhodocyclales bacterium]